MSKTWLIIKREYLTRVRKKSFIIMSVVAPILMAGVIIFSLWLSLEEGEEQKILVVDDSYPMFAELKDSKMIEYDVRPMTLDEALELLETGDHTAVLYIPGNIYASQTGQLYFKKQPSFRIQRQIEETIQQYLEIYKLGEFNISETDYLRLKEPFTLHAFKFDSASNKAEKADMLPAIVGLLFAILIYFFIFLYSIQVMRGVIEEKVNRIVEIVISSVKPFQLMLGKILGVGAVGLTQFIIWIFLTLAIVSIGRMVILGDQYKTQNIAEQQVATKDIQAELAETEDLNFARISSDDNLFNEISRINFPVMLSVFLFYFLGGYFLYSAMMAAVGSVVDNDTDTQQFVLPLTFPLLLSYIVSFSVFENPSSPLAVWMSLIPFTSPVIMMIRVAIGIEAQSLWQVYLSMALLIATFIAMVWLSGKVYRTGILMYGKKASIREIIKWIRY